MEFREYGNGSAGIVLLQPVSGHDGEEIESEISLIREKTAEDFCLVAVRVESWNKDLSPWEAPAVFGREPFGAGAAETLAEITAYCGKRSAEYFIGGYSLAGLFALWAAYQSDMFAGVAAASPSVWFPGFTDYMKENDTRCGNVYLSLGDREEKTRNPVMATVGGKIREALDILKSRNVDCILEWNKGNHFMDADLRTAKAFAWVMDRMREKGGA